MSSPLSLLSLVRLANTFPPSARSECIPVFVGPTQIGLCHPSILPLLRTAPAAFTVREASQSVEINPTLDTPAARTGAVDAAFRTWRGVADCPGLKGWRDEKFDVWGDEGVLMEIERAAVGAVGCRAYGYVLSWNSRYLQSKIAPSPPLPQPPAPVHRSKSKQTYPGMLDNLVGGGLTSGANPHAVMVKECHEEAGIDPDLAAAMVPCGAITFWLASYERGIIPDTEYVFDMELPETFRPSAVDGEVEEFYCWGIDEV
ncbi:hypothetical protein BDK51DRAFT_22190, partial [Blyttiomyces helicus]